MKKVRRAIYTRKSSEDGLEQAFNSLDAQREACAAYVASQKHEGWVLLPDAYDDGGVSGGTLERPGLRRLLRDVDDGLVDQIVVYKIDRLTRSLADFAKLVDRLDAVDASFVSVTQSFNTSTSMGRLTLNVLLSFAQFEREVTAERIRDKIAASKKKGLWMGGMVPLGYEPDGRTLKIVPEEAKTVRTLFRLYREHGTIARVKRHADRLGLQGKIKPNQDASETASGDGQPAVGSARRTTGSFEHSHLHYILTNPVYAGKTRHKDRIHDGQHDAIIDPKLWEDVQSQLASSNGRRRGKTNNAGANCLAGKLFDETGDHLTRTHANKKGRRYRYYVSNRLTKAPTSDGTRPEDRRDGWRLPASAFETQLAKVVSAHLGRVSNTSLLVDPTIEELSKLRSGSPESDKRQDIADANHNRSLLPLIRTAKIASGTIHFALDRDAVAKRLNVDASRINPSALQFQTPFQLRKCGVETKLIIGKDSQAGIDQTLRRNIAKAHHVYRAFKAGETFEAIAEREGVSKRRLMQIIDLAFIAPDILKTITLGTQPTGLTSKRLGQNPLPPRWREQRAIVAKL